MRHSVGRGGHVRFITIYGGRGGNRRIYGDLIRYGGYSGVTKVTDQCPFYPTYPIYAHKAGFSGAYHHREYGHISDIQYIWAYLGHDIVDLVAEAEPGKWDRSPKPPQTRRKRDVSRQVRI